MLLTGSRQSVPSQVQSALSTIPAPNLNDPTASFLQEHPTTANLLREEAGSKASERQSSGHEPEDEADESADGVQARQPEDNIADVIEVVAAGLVHEEGREGMPPDRREAVAAPRITEQAVGGEASDVAGGRTDRVAGGRADMAAEGVRHFFEGAELVDLRPLLVARPLLSPVEEHPVGMGAETSEPERCFQDLGWLKAVFESGWELKGCSQHQRPTAPRLFCVDCFYRQGHERPCCAACSAGAHEGHMVVNVSAFCSKIGALKLESVQELTSLVNRSMTSENDNWFSCQSLVKPVISVQVTCCWVLCSARSIPSLEPACNVKIERVLYPVFPAYEAAR